MNTKTKQNQAERSNPDPRRFTPQQVERSLLKTLAPTLEARGGSAHTFADWTLSGHGIVLRLPNGQEFWCTVAEAGC
jgi:hypothetical protein